MEKLTGVTQPSVSQTDTEWNHQMKDRNKTTQPPLLAASMVSYSELELACQIAASGPFHFTFPEHSTGTTTTIAKIDPDSLNPSPTTDMTDNILEIDPFVLSFRSIGKRKSLVTRTHSPIESTVVSGNQTSIPTSINILSPSMSSTLEEQSVQILPFPSDRNTSAKKRKFDEPNSLSTDQNGSASSRLKISTTFPIIENENGYDCEIPNGKVSVNMIPPTLRGITEAARILRSRNPMGGILTIPTEKFYTSLCFTPFQRNVRSSPASPSPTDPYSAWKILHAISFTDKKPVNPAIFMYHPIQAYNFVAFSAPKTFVFKQTPNTKSEVDASLDVPMSAVTFSESHEILNRLSSAFWPGSVTIYAPVRRRKKRMKKMQGNGSVDSMSSLASLSSDDLNVPPEEFSSIPSIPILPSDLLYSSESLGIPKVDGEENEFVALRCPSHPTARSILELAYDQKNDSKAVPLKKAVIGVCNNCHTNSDEVRNSLLSTTDIQLSLDISTANPHIHVVNGEDRRELITVPACQFGNMPSVSLAIDTPRRQIILHRDSSHVKKENTQTQHTLVENKFDIKTEDIERALHRMKSHDNSSVKAKAIHAVISKWKVVEK